MTINYALRKNYLSATPADSYQAAVQAKGSAGLEEIIERIIDRGSTVTRADIVSVLADYHAAIENFLVEGLTVTTPMANFRAAIGGVFEDESDSFDPTRHELRATASSNKRLRVALANRGRVIKKDAVLPSPRPLSFFDYKSGQKDGSVTPGGAARLTGSKLGFDPADPVEGVFFVAADETETRVGELLSHSARLIMCMLPEDLAPGEYRLQVRAGYAKDEGKVRRGELPVRLTVVP